jgi:hypothetical protein
MRSHSENSVPNPTPCGTPGNRDSKPMREGIAAFSDHQVIAKSLSHGLSAVLKKKSQKCFPCIKFGAIILALELLCC